MKRMTFSLFVLACVLGLFVAYLSAAPTVLSDKQAESMFGSVTCGPCNWTITPVTCPKSADAQGDCISTYPPGCGGEGDGDCIDANYTYCVGATNCDTSGGYRCNFD